MTELHLGEGKMRKGEGKRGRVSRGMGKVEREKNYRERTLKKAAVVMGMSRGGDGFRVFGGDGCDGR